MICQSLLNKEGTAASKASTVPVHSVTIEVNRYGRGAVPGPLLRHYGQRRSGIHLHVFDDPSILVVAAHR